MLAHLNIINRAIRPTIQQHDQEAKERTRNKDQLQDYVSNGESFAFVRYNLGELLDTTLIMIACQYIRLLADSRGAFVQPALYEAFGLTVIEAMTCGLPTFGTRFGGPAEIIKHGESGFHIDPYHGGTLVQDLTA